MGSRSGLMRGVIAAGVFALVPAAAIAGVMLTEDASQPGVVRDDAWVVDMPFDNQWGRFELGGDEEPAAKPATSQRGAPRRRAAANPEGGLLAGAASSGLDDARSLQELLRAYINIGHRAVTGDAASQPEPQAAVAGNVPPVSSAGSESLLPAKMIHGAFVQVLDLALTSSVNDAGLRTISLFGLGEFALMAGGDVGAIAISLGDSLLLSLPMFRDDVPALAQGAAGPAALADASVAGMMTTSVMSPAAIGIDAEGREGASGERNFSADVGSGEQRSAITRMLGLMYEIATYPATALIIVAILGLQFMRSRVESRPGVARRGAHRRRRRGRRIRIG